MSAPVPPIGRGLVTLDELRLTMFRLEGRLAHIEDFLEALGLARAAPAGPAAPPLPRAAQDALAFRPEPVGAAAELPAAHAQAPAAPPPPAPPAPRPATRPARTRAWEEERRRTVYAPYFELGCEAARASIGIEACPLSGDRGRAGARRLAWQEGWRSVMSRP